MARSPVRGTRILAAAARLRERYVDLLAEVDRWFDGCTTRYRQQIRCGAGCSSCCRGLFDITLLDACLLRTGFDRLPDGIRETVGRKAAMRLDRLRDIRPDFSSPYILNAIPEEEWDEVMPLDDETPCVLLDDDGFCLLYDYRPLTCRLHGLPLVDRAGEVLDDACCTLNSAVLDPPVVAGLRGDFTEYFRTETRLVAEFNGLVTGIPTAQLDTLIPAALLTGGDEPDWLSRLGAWCRSR